MRVTLLGAAAIAAFLGLLHCGFSIPSRLPDERRVIVYLFSPFLLALVGGLAWFAASRLKLGFPALTGGLLPFALAGLTLGMGAMLKAIEVTPVRGLDGWIGWGLVAIAFYPAAAVWYLSRAWRTRLIVFGSVLVLAAGMVLYSWMARERWRSDYYASVIHKDVVALLSIPGFRITNMNVTGSSDTSPVSATVGYLLVGDGADRGVTLYVESNLGPGFVPGPGRPVVDGVYGYGLDPGSCRRSGLLRASVAKEICTHRSDQLVMLFEGTGFQIFSKSPDIGGAGLRALAESATLQRLSRHELGHIPVGPANSSRRNA